MACRAGVHEPFRRAGRLLHELAGWSVGAEALRRLVHAEAGEAACRRPSRAGSPGEFAAASGDAELHVDAGKVNTPEGWRDVKVAVFARRERGAPAAGDDHEQRDLPAPSARSVIAGVEDVGRFELRCRAEADRLGLTEASRLSILGDGAEWIWGLSGRQFDGAEEVLDVFHAVEHLAEAGRAAWGDGPRLATWLDEARRLLVGDGYCGACLALTRPPADPEARGRLMAAAPAQLNYFAGHRDRLGYAVRLRRGQAIGSGLVEGTIKQLVGHRLKRCGARWLPHHVGPLLEFMATEGGPEWDEHWNTQRT